MIVTSNPDRIQARLLGLAAVFLALYSLCLTLSSAARANSFAVSYRWEHWLGFALWLVLAAFVHRETMERLPERDPYLFPIAALLAGWGLLTIWRLSPNFGLRQSFWLLISSVVLIYGLRLPHDLGFLRRYKYAWLTGGLILTALTLIFGTNPSGGDQQRLWLGAFGIYLQPSEPLKLLLIAYLAAYLADRLPLYSGLLPLLAPTLIMTGLAMLLLVVQRDLGTTTIFLFLYAVVVYVASGRKRILVFASLGVLAAAVAGYALFDVVRLRVDAWLNPWLDPAGRSYQIVQSLITIASGGVFGRGPGMGSPGFVPVPHSDFVFASISEELGLVGAIGLLVLLALFANRGSGLALRATDAYRRYLAAGLTAFLVGQSLLIIGGNLRLLPLTGVTLPFVSYGGSSLLSSYLALLILLKISVPEESGPAPLAHARPYLDLVRLLYAGIALAALLAGWWALFRAPALTGRTDNPRRALSERMVRRGSLLDRNDQPINESIGSPGEYQRVYHDPDLGAVIGYSDPVYGQSGLEASLDPYLSGLQGSPSSLIWWNELVYGQPPPGLDVRLSLDATLQQTADDLIGRNSGGLALLDAASGEILALASHPGFDPNQLSQEWDQLIQDPRTPLLDRAVQGQYQPGGALAPFLLAAASRRGLPALPPQASYPLEGVTLGCAFSPVLQDWAAMVSNGCPGASVALGNALETGQRQGSLLGLLSDLGLYSPPAIRLPVDSSEPPAALDHPDLAAAGQADLRVSPLQMALAVAALSDEGTLPAPRLALAVNTPQSGWASLPVQGEAKQIFPAGVTRQVLELLAVRGKAYWETTALAYAGNGQWLAWYLAGTLPEQGEKPVALALVLESRDPTQARQIGRQVMDSILHE